MGGYVKTAAMSAADVGENPLFLMDYALRLLRVVVLLALWHTMLAGRETVGVMSLATVLTYTVVAEVFGQQLSVSTTLSEAFWEGTLVLRFLRPMGLVRQFAAEMSGRWALHFAVFSVPLIILAPLLGVVARLEPEKGHRYLIEAMPAILRGAPDAWLLIVGEGSLSGELASFARSLPAPARDRIVFTGRREDVTAITALQRLVNPDVVARVFGVFFALVLGAISLGALLMPILLGSIGLNATLLIMGFAIPALCVAAYPWIRVLDARAQRELSALEPRIATLQTLDIFAGATRAALERLARSAAEETVDAGTVLIREGAEADDFFVLIAGEVEVLASGEAGVEHSLGVLQPPNYFGEIGLLEHRPRTATVKTVTPCTVYRINGSDFVEAMTVATLSPTALGRVQARLARTHPSVSLTFGQSPPE